MEAAIAPGGFNSHDLALPSLVFSLSRKFTSGIFQDFHSWEGTPPAQEGKTASHRSLNSFMHFLIYPVSVQQVFVGGSLCAGPYTMSWGYGSKQTD